MFENLTVVIVNFQTPDLLQSAVESFRAFYSSAPVLLVDNGSKDRSREIIEELVTRNSNCTRSLFLERNIFHGPAMHKAMAAADSDAVLFLDSDTYTLQGGFLEKMLAAFSPEKVYGVGRIDTVNKRGFHSENGTPILLSPYMMLKRRMYGELPPFEHHGMPTLKNFEAARKRGLSLTAFPVERYITHLGRGTASRYGYGLGMRGKIDYVLNKFGL